jgi:5-methylcytosine-specific restriction endonuclease McrA
MAWSSDRPSPRNASRPSDWKERKAAVLKRDSGQCYLCGGLGADQADHIVPVAQGGSHGLDNLAAVHGQPCAAKKNAKEASAARWKYRQRREPEPHPGYIR